MIMVKPKAMAFGDGARIYRGSIAGLLAIRLCQPVHSDPASARAVLPGCSAACDPPPRGTVKLTNNGSRSGDWAGFWGVQNGFLNPRRKHNNKPIDQRFIHQSEDEATINIVDFDRDG